MKKKYGRLTLASAVASAASAPPTVVAAPGVLWAILYTNGEVDMKDLEQECYHNRWCPLLALVPKGQDKPITLVCFDDPLKGVAFIKKNMPAGWIPGVVKMTATEIAYARSVGWLVEVQAYAKKLLNHPNFDAVSVVHDFQDDPYMRGALNLPSKPRE